MKDSHLEMYQTLKHFAPALLGWAGGGLGLLTILMLTSPNAGDGCSCGWNYVMGIVGWPVIIGSTTGLVGSFVFLANRLGGGALLLVGGVLASTPILYLVALSILFPLWFFILAPSLFSALLIVLGALLAIPRTRRMIRVLHDGGWIP